MTYQHTHTHAPEAHTVVGLMLSRDPRKAIKEMIETIEDLKTLYEHETLALQNADTHSFLSLQEEKLKLARFYEDGVKQVMARRHEMKDIDVELKKRLRDLQDEFSYLTTKNIKAIERMKRVSERLGHTIQRAAKDVIEKANTVNYGESGRLSNNERKGVSVNLNETA